MRFVSYYDRKRLAHGLQLLLDGVKLRTYLVLYFERSIIHDDVRRLRRSSLADVTTQCVNVLPEILEEKQQNRRW